MSNLLRSNTPSLINIEVGAAPLTLMPTKTPVAAQSRPARSDQQGYLPQQNNTSFTKTEPIIIPILGIGNTDSTTTLPAPRRPIPNYR